VRGQLRRKVLLVLGALCALALPSAASTAPPTVTLTAPGAGAILRGTVTVSADASADTTSVRFVYFGDAVPGGPHVDTIIGTDNDPPFSISFDTTAFPNTLIKDAAVYAIASNATGEQTQSTGNAVTIDNAGGRIVFERNSDGNSEIWAMNPDGGNLQQLTFTAAPVVNTRPSISPDGNQIAYESTAVSGSRQIWIMNVDGTNNHMVTSGIDGEVNGAPAYSPDGTKIAFERSQPGTPNFQIYVMNADGSGTFTRVTNDAANDVSPSWNPAGTQLVYDSDVDGNREIYKIPVTGGLPTRLTNNTAIDADPDWSPDGQKILFASDRGGPMSIWKMNADGTSPENVTGATIFDADVAWAPDGKHLVYTRDLTGQAFNLFTARPDQEGIFGNAQLQLTSTGAPSRNSFPDWGSQPTGVPTSATIDISSDQASEKAGAQSAPISGIPVDAIRGATEQSSAAAPLAGIPLGGIPLAGIPLAGIPLGGIPLAGIGFTATNLAQNGLGGVPLSTIPLKLPDRWEAHLAGTPYASTPVNNVTLAQVLGTSAVSGVTLKDLDLSASPLAGIPLAGIAFGALPLAGIPIGGNASATSTQNLADWCAFINSQPGFAGSCSGGSSLSGQTMVGLALRGVPLAGIPLAGIPLAGIPLAGIPLGGIPVGTPLAGIPLAGINLRGTPLGGIPLAGIDFAVSPLAGIPLAGINLSQSPLGGIPLGGISAGAKALILNCPTGAFLCLNGSTLAEAAQAGAIKPGATLGQLARYTDANGDPIRIEDIGYYCVSGTPADASCRSGQTPILLKDLVKGLPPDTTLADLLATILSTTAYDWESLPLPGFPLQDFSDDGGKINYSVDFTVQGTGDTTSATVIVHLPAGGRYVPGTTNLSSDTESGGATTGEPTLNAAGDELTWTVQSIPVGVGNHLNFGVKPGLELGTASATARIQAAGLPVVTAPTPETTNITETFPGNDSPFGGAIEGPPPPPIIEPNTLYMGYTPFGTRKSYFRLPVPDAGTQVTVHLSHLHVDDDLVVFGSAPAPLRDPKPGATPLAVPDVAATLGQNTQAIAPEVQTDVPQDIGSLQVLGASDNRGLADEEVSIGTPEGAGGYLLIQVSSYDGGSSQRPWMLRVEEAPPLPLPTTCKQPTGPNTGTTAAAFGSVTGARTLYLINAKRFGDLYGGAAEATVMSKLQTLASRTDEAGGAVIPVENTTAVANAYAAWTTGANYCSPGKANDVVRAIGHVLDNAVSSSVKNVVLVGDDPVIPYGRILDNTSFANERGYTTTFWNQSANDEYLNAYGFGFLPTDDPYGDNNYAGAGPYVPELAVGRLTETPDQIASLVDQYVNRNGVLSPSRSVVTGYDFLTDGAQSIATGLKSSLGQGSQQTQLISDTWSKSDLLSALFPGVTGEIDSINAHFDHNRALPADENAANRETILFTTNDVSSRGPSAVLARLGLTMGCHSGLAVSNKVVSAALQPDWPETWGAGGGAGWMGNTGFGLGDTAAVAYSERLNSLLVSRLDGSTSVGQALMFAKQEYAAIPYLTGYDVKVIDEATLYGLPMYRLGSVTPAAAPTPAPTFTDAATGLPAASFSVSPTFTKVTRPSGSYYTVNGDASFVNRRPIQPTTKLDVTEPNLVAHGAVVTAATSQDESGFSVAYSRVVDDLSALSPMLVGDAIFPSRLQSIATLSTPNGVRQRLLLYAGQFRSGAGPNPAVGIQRRFTSLAGTVLYAPEAVSDFSAPTFGPVSVTAAGSTVGFAVDVNDADGFADVKRVFALYLDASGTWKTAEFSHEATSNRWSGAGPVSGTSVEWFIQAVDDAGNVGVTSNKASIKSLVQPPSVGNISAALSGTLHSSGWYTSNVGVTITAGAGVGITFSRDGGPFQSYTGPLSVTGTGVHVVVFRGSDGSSGSVTIPIDLTNPSVSFAQPTGAAELGQTGNYSFFACADAGSGIASCIPSGIDTATITPAGTTRTMTVTATDRVGRTTTASGSYRVVYPFRGFLEPLSNPPFLNVVQAGQGVPVKFSLNGNRGLSIFASNSPTSKQIPCDAQAPVDDTVVTVTAGSSGLTYDPTTDTYTYVWKTEKQWAGKCRQLNMTLAEGTVHLANFKLK
jgi:Tol biopolymer transport system component